MGDEPNLEPTAPDVLEAISDIVMRARPAGQLAAIRETKAETVSGY